MNDVQKTAPDGICPILIALRSVVVCVAIEPVPRSTASTTSHDEVQRIPRKLNLTIPYEVEKYLPSIYIYTNSAFLSNDKGCHGHAN